MSNVIVGTVKVCIAVVLFFLALEVSARIDDALRYEASFWKEYSADNLHIDEKDGYRRNVPLARFEKWQNNRYGFRGPDFAPDKACGLLRVVCVGSSETYGFHESLGKEWPAQLQELLPANRFQVINAAVVGTSLPSFNRYLTKVVLPVKPDIVVLVVPPLFYFNSSNLPKVVPAKMAVPSRDSRPPQVPLSAKILSNIRCYSKVKQAAKQAIQNAFPGWYRERLLRDLTRQTQELERKELVGRKPYDAIPPQYLQRFHDDLSALVAMLQAQGVQVVLTSYPSLLGAQNLSRFPEMFLGVRKFCIGLSCAGLAEGYDRFNGVSAKVAAERKALFVDCAGQLPKTADYFGDGVHYTDLGARRMSEVMAGALLANYGKVAPCLASRGSGGDNQ